VSELDVGTYLGCYVCGTDNPSGLRLPFCKVDGGGSRAEYTARQEHAGWPGIIHGGLLFTLMDEAVAWACSYSGSRCVTAKAEARFRQPARVGVPLVITGRVTSTSSRALKARAEIRQGADDGELIAELDAMMAVAGPEKVTQENRYGEPR
jgi:uncharacterized protein (TIGR00369 family)